MGEPYYPGKQPYGAYAVYRNGRVVVSNLSVDMARTLAEAMVVGYAQGVANTLAKVEREHNKREEL